MLDSVPMRYKERFGSQKSWVTLQKKEIMQHTRNEKKEKKRKSLNIRDLYHDIAKTIIRGGRL